MINRKLAYKRFLMKEQSNSIIRQQEHEHELKVLRQRRAGPKVEFYVNETLAAASQLNCNVTAVYSIDNASQINGRASLAVAQPPESNTLSGKSEATRHRKDTPSLTGLL